MNMAITSVQMISKDYVSYHKSPLIKAFSRMLKSNFISKKIPRNNQISKDEYMVKTL